MSNLGTTFGNFKWAMGTLGIDKWLVCPVHSMYKDVGKQWVRPGARRCSGCSSGLCPEPASLNNFVRGSVQGLSYRLSMRVAVCRILDDQCRVHCGTAGKVEDMEIRGGEEGPAGERL